MAAVNRHPRQAARRFGLAALLLAGTALGSAAQAQNSLVGTGVLRFGTTGPGSAALGIAANGATVVGYLRVPDTRNTPGNLYGNIDQAVTWTVGSGGFGISVETDLFPFETSPGPGSDFPTASRATAVSADGSVVVGWTGVPMGAGMGFEAFRRTGGITTTLGVLPGATAPRAPVSIAQGVSGDGGIVVGSSHNADGDIQGFRWTGATGMVALPYLAGSAPGASLGQANGISADGGTIVGFATDAAEIHAVRWTGSSPGVPASLGFLGGNPGSRFASALAASADGGVIVGASSNAAGRLQAFRWTAAGGMAGLPGLPGAIATAARLWPDGAPAGLRPSPPYPTTSFAGDLPAVVSVAHAVSPDGTVIVGSATDVVATLHAVRWSGGGIATIADLLGAAGVVIRDWTLNSATGIAVAGGGTQHIVVGTGTTGGVTQAWLARLPAAAATEPTTPVTAPSTGSPTQPPSGLVTLGGLFTSLAQMPSAPAIAERITWANQREALLGAERFGATLDPSRPLTGFVTARGAGWDERSREGGLAGGAGGLIGRLTPWLRAGLFVSHDGENDKLAPTTTRALVWGTGAQVFGLLGDVSEGPRLAASLGYEDLSAKIRRRYANGDGQAEGTGRTEGESWGLAARAAWSIRLDAATTLAPFGQVNWQRTNFDRYAEGYANNPFPAVFDGQSYESLVLGAGLQATRSFELGRLWGSLGYSGRVTGESGATVSGRFVDLFAFDLRGTPMPERRWVEGSLGGAVRLTDRLELLAQAGAMLPTNAAPKDSWQAYGSATLVLGF